MMITYKDIDYLAVGPAIDKLVAEHVMEWTNIEDHESGISIGTPPDGKTLVCTISRSVEKYSQNIFQAIRVAEQIVRLGYEVHLGIHNNCCLIRDPKTSIDICYAHGNTLALSICQAALKLAMMQRKTLGPS